MWNSISYMNVGATTLGVFKAFVFFFCLEFWSNDIIFSWEACLYDTGTSHIRFSEKKEPGATTLSMKSRPTCKKA